MPAKTDLPILTLRELNRALLARQMLLTRQRVGAIDAIERLACLQGQWAPSPYVALWTRLAGFKRDDLRGPIDKGLVIKATLMRATLHLVSAMEYAAYSLVTLDGRFAAWRPPGGPDLAALNDRVIAAKHRPAIYSKHAIVEAVFLIDGFVAGKWALATTKVDAVVSIQPFSRLARTDRAAAIAEGEALAHFMAPDAKTHGARIG